MSTLDLNEISRTWLVQCGPCDFGVMTGCACPDGDYRPVMLRLVEEVERLRTDLDVMYRVRDNLAAEVERLRGELAAEQATHAKTISNFEEFAEAAIEERDRLRHALDDARRERTRARQAFIELVNGGASTGGDSTDGTP